MDKKDNKKLHTPHDAFFKQLFDDAEVVRSFISGELPPSIVAQFNLNTLKVDQNSYVDEELHQYFADVVYSCELKGQITVKVAFLFEHKSFIPQYPHLQILKYMIRIWERQIKEGEKLSPIIPVVIYHGQQKWHKKGFADYFGGGELRADLRGFLPLFEFWLTNLAHRTIDELESTFDDKILQAAFSLMKYIRSRELRAQLPMILKDVVELQKTETGNRNFERMFVYLFRAGGITKKEIITVMEQASIKVEPLFGSIGWEIKQEGIAEGKEEGIAEGKMKGIVEGKEQGKLEVIKAAIQQGLNDELISKITGIAITEIAEIRNRLEKEL